MSEKNFPSWTRDKVWSKYHGSKKSGIDPFGTPIIRSYFEVDHIWPDSNSGGHCWLNGIPMHPDNNYDKSDKYSGFINGKTYKVIDSEKTCPNSKNKIGMLYVEGVLVSIEPKHM